VLSRFRSWPFWTQGTPVQAMDWGTSGASDVNGIAFDNSSPANIVIGGALGATITMQADASFDHGYDQARPTASWPS